MWMRLAFATLLLSGSVAADVTLVTRGPYLQMGAPGAIRIRWRTSAATDSRVRYGTSAAALVSMTDDTALTTEHEIALSGLAPATTYYYSVGSTTATLAGDSSYFFTTSPAPSGAGPTRVWVLGDSGTATASAAAVRDAYLTFTGATPTSLWLMLGDNAYETGSDAEYQSAVFEMYPSVLRTSVLWPALGNHDTAQSSTPPVNLPYFSMFSLPTMGEAGGVASGTEKYYSFDYANIHFVCLDSMSSDRSGNGPMLTWLSEDLASATKQWLIAYWHHPPYSKGSHDSDVETQLVEMRANVLPILEAHGVDLVLSGHSHSYERSFLIDGHYGVSGSFAGSMKKDGGNGRVDGTGAYEKDFVPHAGTVYVVAGTSGKLAAGSLNHPAMFLSLSQLGSVVLDVTGGRLDAKFLRETGVVADSFTIIKGLATEPPALPGGVDAHATGQSQVTIEWTAAAGATSYEILRRGAGTGFVPVGTSTSTFHVDGTVSAGASYLYTVRAVNGAGTSDPSSADLATTIAFTDDPLTPQTTIKATHLASLRDAANAVRTLAGLTPATFTGTATPGVTVAAQHVTELRTALDAALAVLGITTGGYTDAIAPGLAIKAVHFQEIRSRVQ